jgi:hypothetical protein
MNRYAEVHARSLRDTEGFWGEAAREIDWIEPAKKDRWKLAIQLDEEPTIVFMSRTRPRGLRRKAIN